MGLWVFGYGSLIWQPGFAFTDRHIARLDGFERTFCMRSIDHRGSVADPGLVLALDRAAGAFCDGVAFHVAPDAADATLAYLRERELISAAYLEQIHTINLRDAQSVQAVCYVVDPDHAQYCGGLELAEQAEIIARSVGGRGPNSEYLFNTAQHLRELGLDDTGLEWLAARVSALVAAP